MLSKVFNGATNVTLQAVAKIIVQSLNDLSDHGLPVPGVIDGPATCLNRLCWKKTSFQCLKNKS